MPIMPIWKVKPTPNAIDDPRWRGNYMYEVLVRAKNRDMARALTRHKLGDPWDSPWLVSCKRTRNSVYPEAGSPEILEVIETLRNVSST